MHNYNNKRNDSPSSSDQQRRHGAVFLHFLGAVYFFTLLAVVCNDYFLPSVEFICEDLHIPKVSLPLSLSPLIHVIVE